MNDISVDNFQNNNNFVNAIYKSNRLIESSYRLSTSQNRLIYLGMTKLKKTILDKNLNIQQVEEFINKDIFEPIYIDVIDYKKRFNVKSNNLYIELSKIATELYEEEIIYIDKSDAKDKIIRKRWVITCEYDNNKKGISLQFHPSLIKDLLIFQTEFTKMLFDEFVDKLKNKNSFRIYELCKQYSKIGRRDFFVNDLRFKLGLKDEEYMPYGNFKHKLIKIAIKEINENTDLELSFEEIKKDKKTRKVEKIRFSIKAKSNNKQLSIFDKSELAITSDDDTGIVNTLSDVIGKNITAEDAHTIFTESLKAIDDRKLKTGVMDYIKEKVSVCKSYITKTNKDIDNYVGLLIRAVRDDWKDNVVITSNFNNYDQRKYDGLDGEDNMDDLEKKLLGWK